MNSNYKMQQYEAICLILIIMLNKLILNIPYYISDIVGTGAVINVIYIGIVDFIFILIIIKLLKKFQNYDIVDISEFLGGKIFKTIVGIIFVLFFFIVSSITLIDFSRMIRTIYFPNLSITYVVLFFIIAAFVSNILGFKSIVRTICLIIPFSILGVLLAFIGGFQEFTLENFMPILGYNFRTTFIVGSINVFSMYIITYYYFLTPLLKDTINFKKVTIRSYIISWTLLFLTVISILTLFPITSGTEPINTVYLLTRQIEFGTYIQRIDTLFILLWIMSIFSYLSVSIFMINRIVQKIIHISNKKILTTFTCGILFLMSFIPFNAAQLRFIENDLYKHLVIGISFIFCLIILVLANIKFKLKKGNI